jgi:hypothetical protein
MPLETMPKEQVYALVSAIVDRDGIDIRRPVKGPRKVEIAKELYRTTGLFTTATHVETAIIRLRHERGVEFSWGGYGTAGQGKRRLK